jgi:integrase
MMADIAAGKTAVDEKTGFRGRAIVKGGKIAANNTITLLSSMLSFAVARGLMADNPVRGIKKYRARARERFLSQAELARLGETLTTAEQEGVNPCAITAIRLLLLTGCRKNEILSLQWDWVDFERGVLRLPDSKTGAKVVPLGQSAIEILRSIPRKADSPYVIPGSDGSGHFVGLQKVWERLRARAGLDDVRLHDLRHTYASVGAASGESLYIVGKIVGHKQQATTQRYAHLADDPLRKAADRISSQISVGLSSYSSN